MPEDEKDIANHNEPVSSRRKFIKKLGTGALATAGAAALPNLGCQLMGKEPEWSGTYDWLCIGSGIAGCAAAIAGKDKGMKTILIERQEKLGGTTAQSGGSIWVPMNPLMQEKGISDSREEALQYLEFVGGGYSRPEYRAAYVDNALRVWTHLRDKAEFEFRLGGSEFYYPISPGSKGQGRLMSPAPFPSETLGAWRDKVHLSVFVRGMEEALPEKVEGMAGAGPYRFNEKALALWRKRIGAEKVDAIIKKDEATRVGGAALVAYGVRALMKRGVEMRTGTSADQLLMDGDRVIGLTVSQNGKRENLRAQKGVLLALGGDVDGRGGHGYAESWALGAGVGALISATSVIVPMITLPGPGEVFPGGGNPFGRSNTEAGLIHSVIVNRHGQRFGDESFFQDFGGKIKAFETMGEHRFQNFPCFLVFDQNCLDKNSFVGLPPGNTEELDWLTKANSIAELASKMKMPADKLQSTISSFNEYARRHKDPEFNRKPPTMAPIEKPPFYGVVLNAPDPFFAETKTVINSKAQVVRAKGEEPILGLYACGNTTAITRIWGIGYQAGHSLMSAATFGFLAAEHAAGGSVS